jgi:hypothetical protein
MAHIIFPKQTVGITQGLFGGGSQHWLAHYLANLQGGLTNHPIGGENHISFGQDANRFGVLQNNGTTDALGTHQPESLNRQAVSFDGNNRTRGQSPEGKVHKASFAAISKE